MAHYIKRFESVSKDGTIVKDLNTGEIKLAPYLSADKTERSQFIKERAAKLKNAGGIDKLHS